MKELYNQFKNKTTVIDKMKNINILQSKKDDKSGEKYADMPYLETEAAAERIADIYERTKKDDKSGEKYTDMPYLETEEEAAERIADRYERTKKDDTNEIKSVESEESKESEESEKIEYKKINMNNINNLYKDMEKSSFDYVIIDGYRYSIKKVLKYLRNIKNGCYNDNNKMKFYKKDSIDKIKRALNS